MLVLVIRVWGLDLSPGVRRRSAGGSAATAAVGEGRRQEAVRTQFTTWSWLQTDRQSQAGRVLGTGTGEALEERQLGRRGVGNWQTTTHTPVV